MICPNCLKKIRGVRFKCKCESEFCGRCRLPEIHLCKSMGLFKSKSLLKSRLVKILPEKITKL